jgi:hypothetical protein
VAGSLKKETTMLGMRYLGVVAVLLPLAAGCGGGGGGKYAGTWKRT